MLKLDINLPIKYNGTLFSDFASNQSISKAANFAGGGGLEFGLLNLSGNIIAALDRDASGTFNAGDLALDVQDNVTQYPIMQVMMCLRLLFKRKCIFIKD